LKSQVFKQRLKASGEQVAVLRPVGRLFQALGAVTENALSPNRRLDGYYYYLGCIKLLSKTFLSEVLYEADKALEKFAAALRECACLQDGGRSRR